MATGPLKRADMCVSVTRTKNYFSFVGDVEYLIYRPWSSFKITNKVVSSVDVVVVGDSVVAEDAKLVAECVVHVVPEVVEGIAAVVAVVVSGAIADDVIRETGLAGTVRVKVLSVDFGVVK